jgi:hypothetical protein
MAALLGQAELFIRALHRFALSRSVVILCGVVDTSFQVLGQQ